MAEPSFTVSRNVMRDTLIDYLSKTQNISRADASKIVDSWTMDEMSKQYNKVVTGKNQSLSSIAQGKGFTDTGAMGAASKFTLPSTAQIQDAQNAGNTIFGRIDSEPGSTIPNTAQTTSSKTDWSKINTSTILDKAKKILNPFGASAKTSQVKTDPCANLTGAAKVSCYLQQKQSAMIAGDEEWVDYYDKMAQNANAQYELERQSSEDEFARTKEKQRILENMQSLKLQGTNLITGAIESGLSTQQKYLNDGIVMAPGQEYLKGQEPGGELSQIMAKFGVPFQATKMPTIQVNPYAGAQYAQSGVGQAIGNFGGNLQQSTPIPPDQIMSLVQKYFPQSEWDKALYVINRESGYDPNALNNTMGQQVPSGYSPEYSVGLFQINMAAHPQWQDRNLFDPEENIKTAAELWQSSGWQPWTTARDAGFLGTTPV